MTQQEIDVIINAFSHARTSCPAQDFSGIGGIDLAIRKVALAIEANSPAFMAATFCQRAMAKPTRPLGK